MTKKILIVGMHRSGTSFMANFMHKAGLNLGRELIGATPSNKYGHYEDVDFLEFHERLLKINGTTMYHNKIDKLIYDDYYLAKAKSLVYLKDMLDNEWGFKQPRATLFLDLWREILPDANYLILLRHWSLVINSLYTRELNKLSESFQFESNKYQILGQYLKMWIAYSQRLLDHLKITELSRCIIIQFDENIESKLPKLTQYIRNNWHFKVCDVDKHIYDEEVITQKKEMADFTQRLDSSDVEESNRIYKELLRYETFV